MKKFVTHATCHDKLELQEQETYLIMGRTSDLWRVKSEYVGASWGLCLGPLPYCSPGSGVSISVAFVSRVLGLRAALNGGAGNTIHTETL